MSSPAADVARVLDREAPLRPPSSGPLARVWNARWLLWHWVRRDFTVQYRQSLLGVAWAIGQPLLLLLVYGVVFRRVLRVEAPAGSYVVFALCGVVPWAFVSSTILRSVTSLSNAASIIKQVYFPRSVVPLASVGVTLVDLAAATLVLLAAQLASQGTLHAATLGLVPLYLGLALVLGAVAIVAAVLGALVRDVRFVMPLVLQLAFIATPVMYPRELVPAAYRPFVDLSPVAWVIEAMRDAVILGRWPSPGRIVLLLVAGAALLAAALRYAAAIEDRLPDLL